MEGGGDRRGMMRIDVPSHASVCSRSAKSSGPLSLTEVSPICTILSPVRKIIFEGSLLGG